MGIHNVPKLFCMLAALPLCALAFANGTTEKGLMKERYS